jgi:hypothetical protein
MNFIVRFFKFTRLFWQLYRAEWKKYRQLSEDATRMVMLEKLKLTNAALWDQALIESSQSRITANITQLDER